MRKRTIDMDGEKFVISPLTREQVEHYGKILNDGESTRLTVEKAYDALVCMSLNNAQGIYGVPDDQFTVENGVHQKAEANSTVALWTPQRLFREMDPELFFRVLPNAIFELTGLEVRKTAPQPGEPSATSPASPAVPVAA
jgi:hypothetical protein